MKGLTLTTKRAPVSHDRGDLRRTFHPTREAGTSRSIAKPMSPPAWCPLSVKLHTPPEGVDLRSGEGGSCSFAALATVGARDRVVSRAGTGVSVGVGSGVGV